MLLNERFSLVDKIWEDISKEKHDWASWKKMYKESDRNSRVKKQSVGGQDQFGASHSALSQVPQSQQSNGPTKSATDLDKYFDALAAAVTTEKWVLEELMKANAALATTNTELLASVSSLIKSSDQISCRVGNHHSNLTFEDYPAPRPKTMCPHCNIILMYAPNNCFYLEKNATIRPRGWKSCLWQWGTSKIVDNKFN